MEKSTLCRDSAIILDVLLVGCTGAGKSTVGNLVCNIPLEDEPHGAVKTTIDKFETESSTWSKLRHPEIAELASIHLEPVLVMKTLNASLHTFLENHNKQEISDKLKVLHQVCQALLNLHGPIPPLLCYDLSLNKILVNEIFLAPEEQLETSVVVALKAHAISMAVLHHQLSYAYMHVHFDESPLQQLLQVVKRLDLEKIEISFGRNLGKCLQDTHNTRQNTADVPHSCSGFHHGMHGGV